MIGDDDIVFFDFGPVFEDWEADFGRTYVLGSDERKRRLQADIEACWWLGKAHFDSHPDITGSELRRFVIDLCAERGLGVPAGALRAPRSATSRTSGSSATRS